MAPYLIKNTGKAKAPKCYRITGSAKERPDFWVSDPMQSVVLQVRQHGLVGEPISGCQQ